MNKHQRKILQSLIKDAKVGVHYMSRGYALSAAAALEASIAAAEKLLNPPVRFAWTRLSGSGGTYFADVAGVSYEVSRLIVPSGRGWLASANDEVFSGSFSTLAQAKQACVDYGVARTKAKQQAEWAATGYDPFQRPLPDRLKHHARPLGNADPARGSQSNDRSDIPGSIDDILERH